MAMQSAILNYNIAANICSHMFIAFLVCTMFSDCFFPSARFCKIHKMLVVKILLTAVIFCTVQMVNVFVTLQYAVHIQMGVLSIRRISIRRIPIIGLGIGLGLGLGIGFGELKFGELKRNHTDVYWYISV